MTGRRRRGRLQARMARYIALAVVVSLVVSTAGIVLYRFYSSREILESSARDFAVMASVPLAQVTDMFGEAGMKDPVMARVASLVRLNPDVEKLEIVRMNGSVAFSATRDQVEVWPRDELDSSGEDLGLSREVGTRVVEAGRMRVDGKSVYRVVVPADDSGESFALSMVAVFSYDRVNRQLRRGVFFLFLALAVGMIVTERVSAILSRSITRNLADLQAGVRRIRAGRLDERVDIHSEDEIQELGDAFNDMTEDLQQTIGRLREANTELQALDQLKGDLVANVSHELRTPLTALKGFLELLDEGELGEIADEAHRAVSVCRRNVDRLAVRVEDLVQLSQMEKAWPEELVAEPIDIVQLITMVTEIYQARIRSKELQFSFDAPTGLSTVSGNFEQLERVILNLMDNAVKFTPQGGTVIVTAEECDHEGREGVLIRVVDSGIGIPTNELVRVFDRFHQVDPSTRRRFGGMGLGLSLVHHIVESHRGVVWAESDGESGTTFFVWLPCESESEAVQRRAVAPV